MLLLDSLTFRLYALDSDFIMRVSVLVVLAACLVVSHAMKKGHKKGRLQLLYSILEKVAIIIC